jgi:hypothetical protein
LTEPAGPTPTPKPSDITRLLYKAVKSLSEDEQAAVFEYFFERGLGSPMQSAPFRAHDPSMWLRGFSPETATVVTAKKPGQAQQVIPVRLSEETHRRLKQWSADHDFHMSVVVRGLVERFLDSWQERPAAAQT